MSRFRSAARKNWRATPHRRRIVLSPSRLRVDPSERFPDVASHRRQSSASPSEISDKGLLAPKYSMSPSCVWR
nr:hypothetical protein [Lacipirellula parvula]